MISQNSPPLREHHHGPVPEAAAGEQGPLSRGGRRVLADHARQDSLQHRGAGAVRSRRGRRRVRAAADVAPGELWRAGGAALVPPGHERLPVSSAHVRGGLMRLATLCLSAGLLSGCGGGGPASTAPAIDNQSAAAVAAAPAPAPDACLL